MPVRSGSVLLAQSALAVNIAQRSVAVFLIVFSMFSVKCLSVAEILFCGSFDF